MSGPRSDPPAWRGPVPFPDPLAGTRSLAPGVAPPDALIHSLRSALGAGAVQVGTPGALAPWGRDWWPRAAMWATHGLVPAAPQAVVRPADLEGVATTLRLATEHRVPVTPAAGRSGVCGGAIPVAGGIVLDLTALDRILDIDDRSLRVRTEAGVFGPSLAEQLAATGHTLGHWPQSIEISTVGGWLACRSAGQYSTRYGKIEDMVVGVEAVTGAGALLRTGGPPRAALGPDLTQVLVGSEGTLAVITSATLRIHPTPTAERRAAFGFATFELGLDACRRILRRGATPAVLRLYDATESRRSYEQNACVLLLLDEGDPAVVDAVMTIARQECEATPTSVGLDAALVGRWLAHRNDLGALGQAVSQGLVVDTVEVAAPWARVPALYSSVIEEVRALEGTVAVSAHCSHSYLDGTCLYFTFAGHVGDDLDRKDAYYLAAFGTATRATIAAGGAIAHHHGVGLNRARFLGTALGDPAMHVLAGLKGILDPAGILNPGVLGLPSPFIPAGAPLFPGDEPAGAAGRTSTT